MENAKLRVKGVLASTDETLTEQVLEEEWLGVPSNT